MVRIRAAPSHVKKRDLQSRRQFPDIPCKVVPDIAFGFLIQRYRESLRPANRTREPSKACNSSTGFPEDPPPVD